MKNKKEKISILVLGARPENLKKKFSFKKIYTANAAIQLADTFNDLGTKITSICADLVITRDQDVMNIVFKCQPKRLITRGVIEKPKELTKCEIFKCISYKDQLLFQNQFFKFGIFPILFAEFFIYGTLTGKIKNIYNCIKYRRLTGVSTGLFSILFALYENPNQKILISGIGMRDEAHFYQSNYRKKFLKRVLIDNYLSKYLKKKYKKHLYTYDDDLAKIMDINLLNVKSH